MAIGLESSEATGSLTRRFAAVCSQFTYDSLPESVQQQAKLILIDTLGAMIGASRPQFPGTARLSKLVESECNSGPSSIVGLNLQTSPANAALMNGYLAYSLDSESHHGPAVVHAAAAVVPAALAVAQEKSSDGASFLAAIVLGIDVACRISLAIGPNDLYSRGFHPTAIAGAFGAASASALLLGLDEGQIERAMGLAATQASGLLAWASDESEESRPFNPGLAARNGVTAARLAALGFGAPVSIFDIDAKYNVFRAWSLDGKGTPAQLIEGLGEVFSIESLTVKQYACCAFIHPGIDGLLSIVADEGIGVHDIAEIHIRYPTAGAPIIDNNPLRSHRAQYILPLAAVRGTVEFEDVINDRSSESDIRRLVDAVTFTYDDELDQLYPERYATITQVVTSDRRAFERRNDWARGTPENPMTDAEIRNKFFSLASRRFEVDQCNEIVSVVISLDRSSNIDDLVSTLTSRNGH